jgi:hypothetical protein
MPLRRAPETCRRGGDKEEPRISQPRGHEVPPVRNAIAVEDPPRLLQPAFATRTPLVVFESRDSSSLQASRQAARPRLSRHELADLCPCALPARRTRRTLSGSPTSAAPRRRVSRRAAREASGQERLAGEPIASPPPRPAREPHWSPLDVAKRRQVAPSHLRARDPGLTARFGRPRGNEPAGRTEQL